MNRKLTTKRFSMLLLVLIFILSCQESISVKETSLDNFIIVRYNNGNIKSLTVKGESNSFRKIWFDLLGNIQQESRIKDSMDEGQAIWFYPNGNIQNTVIFKNGKANGAAFMFYEDGAIKNHRYWKDGKRVGYSSDFIQDSIGTLENIYFYDNDTMQWWRPSAGHSMGISV